MLLRVVVLCFIAMFLSSSTLAGDLNPPVGPVSPSMKNLSTVEPRTAINATNTPGDADSVFKITQPGSYYLTANIQAPAGKHGIEIASSNVTIDLMGFELFGLNGSLDGIHSNSVYMVAIRNGTLRGWNGDGIDMASGQSLLIEDVIIRGVVGNGIVANFLAIVRNCSVNDCQTGIVTNCCSLIHNCQIGSCLNFAVTAGQNVTVIDCVFNNCQGGVAVGNSSLIARCTFGFTYDDVIQVGSQCLVMNNFVDGSTAGINATGIGNRIDSNHVANSGTGIIVSGTGNLIVNNFTTGNSTEYNVVAGNLMGPIVTSATIATNTNPHANYQN